MTVSPFIFWKRRLDKGIRNSANQPSSFIEVSTSQYEFQLVFNSIPDCPSKTVASHLKPLGVVKKAVPFSLSL
ncbi:MAG: hypothetical protein C0597_06940 [Marinilabiliales bacterium]|nr:MAG: hypothetical protein C0597_06940 [Marinilabiliales bacterium]